jgi:hypothetical protein
MWMWSSADPFFPTSVACMTKASIDPFGHATSYHTRQCSRLKCPMPFKHDLALQNIPLLKKPFKTQPQIGNEDVVI